MSPFDALFPVLALAGGLGLLLAALGLLADYLLPALFLALGRPDWHAWLMEDRP